MENRHFLVNSAQSWFEVNIDAGTSYAEFRSKFLSLYWYESHQLSIRNKLNTGKYEFRGKLSMAEYFIELRQLARLLDQPLPPRNFIEFLEHHFPAEIKSTLVVAKPQAFDETINLLKHLRCRKVSDRPRAYHGETPRSPKKGPKPEINQLFRERGTSIFSRNQLCWRTT